jgi:hypothetical protein
MHLIRHFQLDTHAATPALGKKLAQWLPDLLTDAVIPQLDSLLDSLPAEVDIRIDQLVCNLGLISYSQLKRDLPRLIIESLLKHLRQNFIPSASPEFPTFRGNADSQILFTEHGKRTQHTSESQLEALLHFLSHGHFPWWLATSDWPNVTRIETWPDPPTVELRKILSMSLTAGVASSFHRFIRHISTTSLEMILERSELKTDPFFTQTRQVVIRELTSHQKITVLSMLWLLPLLRPQFHLVHPASAAATWRKLAAIPDLQSLPVVTLSWLKKIFLTPALETTSPKGNSSESLAPLLTKALLPTEVPAQLAIITTEDLRLATSTETFRNASTTEYPITETTFSIPNAGIVLLHPFIPHLFQGLNWLDAEKNILPPFRWHAVQALHYLSGGEAGFSEPSLLLTKILCGLPIAALAENPTLSPEAYAECDALLIAAIQYWTILGKTSPNGLRENFLTRCGLLSQTGSAWDLQVERQAIDLLLGHLPWPLSIVKFPWMKHPLTVTWAAGH